MERCLTEVRLPAAGAAASAVSGHPAPAGWALPEPCGNVASLNPAWAPLALLSLHSHEEEQEADLTDVKPEKEKSRTPTAALNSAKPKHFANPPIPQGFPSPKYLVF